MKLYVEHQVSLVYFFDFLNNEWMILQSLWVVESLLILELRLDPKNRDIFSWRSSARYFAGKKSY